MNNDNKIENVMPDEASTIAAAATEQRHYTIPEKVREYAAAELEAAAAMLTDLPDGVDETAVLDLAAHAIRGALKALATGGARK